MSRKQRKHIRGKRGEAILEIVPVIDRAHILCVSLDISKYFHVVKMHNAYEEIVTPTFEIDIFCCSGFERLCQAFARPLPACLPHKQSGGEIEPRPEDDALSEDGRGCCCCHR